jgi:hypothetical protein
MPPRFLHLAVLASLLPGCKQTDPLYCDPSTPCTDPDRPFCDDNGEYPASDGIKHTCIPDPFGPDAGPDQCQPDAFIECTDEDTAVYCDDEGTSTVPVSCEGGCDDDAGCSCEAGTTICEADQTVFCTASGTVDHIQTCPLGCHSGGERCLDIQPSNDLGAYLEDAANGPEVVIEDLSGEPTVVNTSTGTITLGDGTEVLVPSELVPAQPGGVSIRVFTVRSFRVTRCTELSTSPSAPALAIVADGDVEISCHVRPRSGAFDATGCRGGPAVATTDNGNDQGPHAGAGGGGFGSPGGSGGTSGGEPGGTGGGTSGEVTLEPLRGGCPGGRDSTAPGSNPGGAIQIVSRTAIRLSKTSTTVGILDAGGSLGLGFAGALSAVSWGGGSGGAILLEAPTVDLVEGAAVVANGGGGGASHCASNGVSGLVAVTQAAGGTCPDDVGEGGYGGALDDTFLLRGDNAGVGFSSGGGGGGVGRIRINTVIGGFTAADGSVVSPAASFGAIGTQ